MGFTTLRRILESFQESMIQKVKSDAFCARELGHLGEACGQVEREGQKGSNGVWCREPSSPTEDLLATLSLGFLNILKVL